MASVERYLWRHGWSHQSREAFDLHGGAVSEDFGYALHNFGGVIAHGDDGIGAVLGGMLQQQLVGVFARPLTKIRQDGNVAADDGLQRRAQIPDYAARPDYNSAHDAKVLNDSIAGDFIGRGDHGTVHAVHNPLLVWCLPVRFYLFTQRCGRELV